MLDERLNYLSVLSVENLTKLLSYEDAIKKYGVKKCRGGDSIKEVRHSINKLTHSFIFLDFVMFVVFVNFFF